MCCIIHHLLALYAVILLLGRGWATNAISHVTRVPLAKLARERERERENRREGVTLMHDQASWVRINCLLLAGTNRCTQSRPALPKSHCAFVRVLPSVHTKKNPSTRSETQTVQILPFFVFNSL